MAINFKIESAQLKDPKQKRLLIVAVVFFVGAGVLYWRLFFSGPDIGVTLLSPAENLSIASSPAEGGAQTLPAGARATARAARGVSEEALRRVRLDTEVVKTELFKELQLYGSYPITIPAKGNPYPFRKPPASSGPGEIEGEEE